MLSSTPYHIGLVVEDLDSAMIELTRFLGLSWAKTQRRSGVLHESPDGPEAYDMYYVYSIQGPPYIEMIEQRPSSPYAQLGLHHIGLWTDDSTAQSEQLIADGHPRETAVLGAEGKPVAGFYHHLLKGLRVELVDAARSGPRLVRYLRGGDYA